MHLSDDDPTLRFERPPLEESLRYTIELLYADGRGERVLALAHSNVLARAVFQACADEFPGRVIVLREGTNELARCGG